MKPFNLEQAKAGAPVQTRDGRPVRILATDIKGCNEPIAAAIDDGEYEVIDTWQVTGAYNQLGEHYNDLFMAPVQRTVWVPLYRGRMQAETVISGCVYHSEEYARQCAIDDDRIIGVFPITYEE